MNNVKKIETNITKETNNDKSLVYCKLCLINNKRPVTSLESKKILALLKNDSIFGCQFHPEISGKIGLEFLETFINYTK